MTARISFQQESDPDGGKMPWSVQVDHDGTIIHGRPDADYLVGFGPVNGYSIPVSAQDALENPARAVGLAPRYQKSGDMFGVELPVRWCIQYTIDDAGLARLRAAEQVMRDAWDRSNP